jgi:hypothetical protein
MTTRERNWEKAKSLGLLEWADDSVCTSPVGWDTLTKILDRSIFPDACLSLKICICTSQCCLSEQIVCTALSLSLSLSLSLGGIFVCICLHHCWLVDAHTCSLSYISGLAVDVAEKDVKCHDVECTLYIVRGINDPICWRSFLCIIALKKYLLSPTIH